MEKVKAGLRGLTAGEKLQKGVLVFDQMSGNPHFPDPLPSMVELKDALIELREATIAAEDRGRKACLRKRLAVSNLEALLSRLAAYVNSAGQGDSGKLITSGFELTKRPEQRSYLAPPNGLYNRFVRVPGQIRLYWPGVPGAVMYELEIARNNEQGKSQWERLKLTSKPEYLVSGLEPNTMHAFRVRAIGTQAEGSYSQILQLKSAA